MDTSEPAVLTAWSNGRWIHLDLVQNRYFAGKAEPDQSLQNERIAAVARLREQPSELRSLIPPAGMIAHYLRSATVAWRAKQRPIREQVAILRPAAPRAVLPALSPAGVAQCAVMYQHMRNLRLRRPQCLEDSVGCALFLRQYVETVSFHIGVVQPSFMAHAWVQSGDLLMNDAKEAVERYTEILRVDL